MKTHIHKTKKPLFILLLLFTCTLLVTCEKIARDNPWDADADLDPNSWAPQNLFVEDVGFTSKKLTWDYFGDPRIEGFLVERKTSGSQWTVIEQDLGKDDRQWTDNHVLPDPELEYGYRLYAFAGDNRSAYAEVSSSAQALPPLTNLDFTVNNCNSISLQWEYAHEGQQGFRVYRKTGNNGWELYVELDDPQAITFTDDTSVDEAFSLKEHLYAYRLQAYYEYINSDDQEISTGIVMDNEENTYATLCLDDNLWMNENLRTITYNDNSEIDGELSTTNWQNTDQGAFAIYPHQDLQGLNSFEDVLAAYGVLYNWHAVNDPRGLCPPGWRVPSRDEWDALISYVTDNHNSLAGNLLKSCRQLGSPLGGDCNTSDHPRWDAHSEHYGVDAAGFAALPGGQRNDQGAFDGVGSQGIWWTSTSLGTGNAWRKMLLYDQGDIFESVVNRNSGFSVRCVKE